MKQRKKTNRVIFHHSLSSDVSVGEIRNWHIMRKFEDVGYHYVVRKDGTLETGRPLEMVGEHARLKNYDSVGICITGNFEETEPTLAQLDTCNFIYNRLCEEYNKELKIQFHRRWPNPCPGRLLDRQDFLEVVGRVWKL